MYNGPLLNVFTFSTTNYHYHSHTDRTDSVSIYEHSIELFPNLKHFRLLYSPTLRRRHGQLCTGSGAFIRSSSRELAPQDNVRLRRLESLEIVEPLCWNKIYPCSTRLSELVDWKSLRTIKMLNSRHLPNFIGQVPNLRRLSLSFFFRFPQNLEHPN